jgi:glycosyltransferase involved in cell wall biosynthesis
VISVGIVIPCYNEGTGLIRLLQKCESSNDPRVTYLLVNNGSTDETKQLLSSQRIPANVRILHLEENLGYGFGILQGLKALKTDFVGWTHADLQTDPADVVTFLSCLDEGFDFMKGNRIGRPFIDRFFSTGMSLVISMLFLRKMKDINAQPTIFRRNLMKHWDNPPRDFALDLYAYLKATKANCKMKRLPVKFGPRQWGNSHWNTSFSARLRFVKRTLKYAIKLRIEWQ